MAKNGANTGAVSSKHASSGAVSFARVIAMVVVVVGASRNESSSLNEAVFVVTPNTLRFLYTVCSYTMDHV